MKDFFLISHTFLYRNCDLLNLQDFVLELCESNIYGKLPLSDNKFKNAFFEKFKFFDEIINCLFQYKVSLIEIYISGSGMVDGIENFEVLKTDANSFLPDLFSSLVDTLNNHFDYEFQNAKFLIPKQN